MLFRQLSFKAQTVSCSRSHRLLCDQRALPLGSEAALSGYNCTGLCSAIINRKRQQHCAPRKEKRTENPGSYSSEHSKAKPASAQQLRKESFEFQLASTIISCFKHLAACCCVLVGLRTKAWKAESPTVCSSFPATFL